MKKEDIKTQAEEAIDMRRVDRQFTRDLARLNTLERDVLETKISMDQIQVSKEMEENKDEKPAELKRMQESYSQEEFAEAMKKGKIPPS